MLYIYRVRVMATYRNEQLRGKMPVGELRQILIDAGYEYIGTEMPADRDVVHMEDIVKYKCPTHNLEITKKFSKMRAAVSFCTQCGADNRPESIITPEKLVEVQTIVNTPTVYYTDINGVDTIYTCKFISAAKNAHRKIVVQFVCHCGNEASAVFDDFKSPTKRKRCDACGKIKEQITKTKLRAIKAQNAAPRVLK